MNLVFKNLIKNDFFSFNVSLRKVGKSIDVGEELQENVELRVTACEKPEKVPGDGSGGQRLF